MISSLSLEFGSQCVPQRHTIPCLYAMSVPHRQTFFISCASRTNFNSLLIRHVLPNSLKQTLASPSWRHVVSVMSRQVGGEVVQVVLSVSKGVESHFSLRFRVDFIGNVQAHYLACTEHIMGYTTIAMRL